ncbi:porin [Marinobacterium lutimaris]|uniref:Outer membrane protein (Porin) n=1 Tax=Marinobacterium lutimaris TaxID=568106 RepID=A0A1H5UAU2_9GAMM|nr:porin [Marinobacterium lutimaris]SEF72119.1 Outer membrane protein (porin) [Marinobacterium lutimaris]
MKKSLIALAVAGAMTAPVVAQADATLYGNVEIEGVFANDADAEIQVDDARMGVKGSDETYIDGVSSFYQIELEYNPDSVLSDGNSVTVRKASAGLTGGFGTVIGGRFSNPVESTELNDLYSESLSTDFFFRDPDRIGSALAYITPTFGGFSAYAGIAADGNADRHALNGADNDREDLDGYLVGADYTIGGFGAHLGYWSMDKDGDSEAAGAAHDAEYIGLALSYAVSNFTFTGSYAEADSVDGGFIAGTVNTELWTLAADYAMENTNFGISYMDYQESQKSNDIDADEWGVYVSHKLSNKASVKAQYTSADVDNTDIVGEDVFVVGYNVSF